MRTLISILVTLALLGGIFWVGIIEGESREAEKQLKEVCIRSYLDDEYVYNFCFEYIKEFVKVNQSPQTN